MYPWALFQTKKTPSHLEAFRAFSTESLSYTPSKARVTTYQKTQIGYNSELTMLLQKSALEDANWNSKLSRGRNKHLHFEELGFLVCSSGHIDRNKLIVFYLLLSKSGQHSCNAGRVSHSIDLDRHIWTDDTNTDEVKERKMGTRVRKYR